MAVFIFNNITIAQNFNVSFGGEGKESIQNIFELDNGELIGIGYTLSQNPANAMPQNHGKSDVWFLRLNKKGEVIANRLIGTMDAESTPHFFKLKNDRFLLISSTIATSFPSNISFTILDGYGNIIKDKKIENSNVYLHDIQKVIPVSESDYIFAGNVNYTDTWQHFFGKIDSSLNVSFFKLYNLENSDNHMIKDFALHQSGEMIGVGEKILTDMFSQRHSFVQKVNDVGDTIWNIDLGDVSLTKVVTFDDGHAIIAGSIKNETLDTNDVINQITKGEEDILLLKVDSSGNIIWNKAIGSSLQDRPISMQKLKNGTVVLLMSTLGNNGEVPDYAYGKQDIWLVNIDTTGNILSNKLFGGNENDFPKGILQTEDSGFILWGVSESSKGGNITETNHGKKDAWIIKLNANATIEWQRLIGGHEDDEIQNITLLSDSSYLLMGETYSSKSGDVLSENKGESDAWIIKLDKDGNFDTRVSNLDLPLAPAYQIYPNPFKEALQIELHLPQTSTISLAVYDASGKLIHTLAEGKYTQGKHWFSWKNADALNRLAVGSYWLTFTDKDHRLSGFSTVIQKH